MYHFQGFFYLLFVCGGQNSQPAGIRITPAGYNIVTGHHFRLDPVGQHHRHAGSQTFIGHGLNICSIQDHTAADALQLSGDAFEDGRLAGTVGTDQCHDFSLFYI